MPTRFLKSGEALLHAFTSWGLHVACVVSKLWVFGLVHCSSLLRQVALSKSCRGESVLDISLLLLCFSTVGYRRASAAHLVRCAWGLLSWSESYGSSSALDCVGETRPCEGGESRVFSIAPADMRVVSRLMCSLTTDER